MSKQQRKSTSKKSIDVELVRQAAAGRWLDILPAVTGVSAETFDGRHHACPKCGGKDRFRMIDAAAGAVYCNGCFKRRNGDGFATVGWMLGTEFPASVAAVADHLGIDAGGQKKKPPPDAKLEWRPWCDFIVWNWCRSKPGVTPEAVKAAGGRLAKYLDRYHVLAFPIFGQQLDAAPPVGWALYHSGGLELPKFDETGNIVGLVKVKLTYGSTPGIIGDLSRLRQADAVWKLEGVSDVLSWLSMSDIPGSHACVTNANGTLEKPKKWVAELFAGKTAYVLHDADRPGQEGAMGWTDRGQHREGWAEVIAGSAKECWNVRLPFPTEETHGRDLRDWLGEGHTFEDLRDLAQGAERVQPYVELANEEMDDPYRLARLNLDRYATRNGGRTIRYWHDSWWLWKNHRYTQVTKGELRAKISGNVKEEFDRHNLEQIRTYSTRREAGKLNEEDDKGPPKAKKVMPGTVSAVIDATNSLTCVSGDVDLNTWLPTRQRRNLISMANGLFDVDAYLADAELDELLLPHSPEWFSTVCLPYKFDPHATCPKWEKFLEKNLEMDPERIKVVQEWAGYLLTPDTSEQRFMILEGEGSNGKSVYCAGIEGLLGQKNCSYVQLEHFGDQFSKTGTLGKLVNICGDAGEIDKVAEGVIKAFTAGNPLAFDRKGIPAIHCVPTAKLMVACNNRPRFADRTQGVWRRMLLIPWKIQITKHEKVRNMDKPEWWAAQGELPGMFRWALQGLWRLREQGGFSDCKAMDDALSEYQLEMNPTKQFLLDHFEAAGDDEETDLIKVTFVYDRYRKWVSTSGHHAMSSTQFGKEVARAFRGIRRVRRGPREGRVWCYEGLKIQEGIFATEETFDASPTLF